MPIEKITCVITAHAHRHIVSVGLGDRPNTAHRTMTVMQVREAIRKGDTFYTMSPSTGRIAVVYIDTCGEADCTVMTIRSEAEVDDDHNLINLVTCP